jgi:hypothetical protein
MVEREGERCWRERAKRGRCWRERRKDAGESVKTEMLEREGERCWIERAERQIR